MFDDNDEAKRDDGRIAALSGSVRRRHWSAAEKAAVVKETLVPGVCVSDVARRWQLDPQQVYRWRHQDGVTHGKTLRASQAAEVAFVPIVTDVMPVGEMAPVKLRALNPVGFITTPARLLHCRSRGESRDSDDGRRPRAYRSAPLFARGGRAAPRALCHLADPNRAS
jgi:transposase-like protein